MRSLLLHSLAFGACLTAASSFAASPQNNSAPAADRTGWSWSGHVDHVTIDAEAARAQGINEGATAIGGAAEYYSTASENTLSLGTSILFYRDNAEFSQYVESYWGDEEYSESDANALMLFAEYGPKYRFGQHNTGFLSVRAGVSAILGSERSISNCSNCYSEDIDIDGGVYGLLGIGQTLGRLDLSLQYQQYLSGDLDNTVRLKLSSAF